MAEENMKAPSNPTPIDDRLLEARITAALQTARHYTMPSGFAARVAGQVAPLPPASVSARGYGYRTAVICLGVLFVLLVAFAYNRVGPSLYAESIEAIFCAQFALLAVWLVARDYTFFNDR